MKKRVYNKSTGRDYDREKDYEKKTVEGRSSRNKARATYLAFLTEKYGAKRAKDMMHLKDVDHKKELSEGGSNKLSNLRLVSRSYNRSRRDH